MSPKLMTVCLLFLMPFCVSCLISNSVGKDANTKSPIVNLMKNLRNKVRQARERRSYLDNRVDTFPTFPDYYSQRQETRGSAPDLHLPSSFDPMYDLAGTSDFGTPHHRDMSPHGELDFPPHPAVSGDLDLSQPLDLSSLNLREFQDDVPAALKDVEEDPSSAHRPLDLSFFSLPKLDSQSQDDEFDPDLDLSSVLPSQLELPKEAIDASRNLFAEFEEYLELKASGALDACLKKRK